MSSCAALSFDGETFPLTLLSLLPQVTRLEEAKSRADTQWRTQLITFEAEVKKRQSQTQAELAQLRAKVAEVH
jgi:hypothetical protein